MTRFEEACECPFQMAVMVCFCIAAYIEQNSGYNLSKEELKFFIEENCEIIEEWLMEESKTNDR